MAYQPSRTSCTLSDHYTGGPSGCMCCNSLSTRCDQLNTTSRFEMARYWSPHHLCQSAEFWTFAPYWVYWDATRGLISVAELSQHFCLVFMFFPSMAFWSRSLSFWPSAYSDFLSAPSSLPPFSSHLSRWSQSLRASWVMVYYRRPRHFLSRPSSERFLRETKH